MGANTEISWTDSTWNPIRGCSMAKGSELGGCLNCYAARLNARNLPELRSPTTGEPFARIMQSGPRWTGKVELIEHLLDKPLYWKRPRKIFVNSQSDLFHEELSFDDIDRVFAVMALCAQHTFQVLTKRPERMQSYIDSFTGKGLNYVSERLGVMGPLEETGYEIDLGDYSVPEYRDIWPLPGVWLGVSVEDQKTADQRIPLLLRTPAAKRFISAEPLLGPIDFRAIPHPLAAADWVKLDALSRIDQVITGGESGPGARPANPQWFRDIRDQCSAAGVAYFHKQNGEWVSVSEVEGPGKHFTFPGGRTVRKVGKKAAGCLLDGREWKQFPELVEAV